MPSDGAFHGTAPKVAAGNPQRKTASWICATTPLQVLRGHRQQTEGVGEMFFKGQATGICARVGFGVPLLVFTTASVTNDREA
jgi:hypothetical protein